MYIQLLYLTGEHAAVIAKVTVMCTLQLLYLTAQHAAVIAKVTIMCTLQLSYLTGNIIDAAKIGAVTLETASGFCITRSHPKIESLLHRGLCSDQRIKVALI